MDDHGHMPFYVTAMFFKLLVAEISLSSLEEPAVESLTMGQNCHMVALCTSCDYEGSETLIGIDHSLESCKRACMEDSSCLGIDFGENSHAGECYLNQQQYERHKNAVDFGAWIKKCSLSTLVPSPLEEDMSQANGSFGLWPSWMKTTAKDKANAAANVPRLLSGGKVFLLSSLSHDDNDQWSLIPHFFRHYCGHLGIHPSQFLLILHSDAQDLSGIQRMSEWLNQKYGVEFTYPVVEPYTSIGHFQLKMKILKWHVRDEDWVVQVDADEFLFFPLMPSRPHGFHDLLNMVELFGRNVYYGLMVDRVSEDGSAEHAPIFPTPLHNQYSLNCGVTLLLQKSDVRKASAYRGYLRTTTGNHNVIGLNESVPNLVAKPEQISILLRNLRSDHAIGPVYDLLPGVEKRTLPVIRPAAAFATVYHYKWIKGLTGKIFRRYFTEEYTQGQYSPLNELLRTGSFPKDVLNKLCNMVASPDVRAPIRALSPEEFMYLFFNVKPEMLQDAVHKFSAKEGLDEEVWITNMLQSHMKAVISREDQIPVD